MARAERFALTDLDNPDLRLIIEGSPNEEPSVSVEIGLGPDWIALHDIERQQGVWTVSAAKDFAPRVEKATRLTARLQRQATVHCYVPRINRLLTEALDLDRELNLHAAPKLAPWWDRLVDDWGLSELRSRRGRAPRINPQEVERLASEGLTYRQIGQLRGAHRKSVYRAMNTARKRYL